MGYLIVTLSINQSLFFLGSVSNYLRKFSLFDTFFIWLFKRTQDRSKLIERLELLGLTLFVAVPLPITGAWTGAVAAFLFRFRIRDAFGAICLGGLGAGVLVTLACLGVLYFIPLIAVK